VPTWPIFLTYPHFVHTSLTVRLQFESAKGHLNAELSKRNANEKRNFAAKQQLRKKLKGFELTYFSHHLYLPPGQFHDELIVALENPDEEFVEIIGFRGSSRTTWGSLVLPMFFALERNEEYPFIILAADTSVQSGINIANIKHELENITLLLQDYGKFEIGTTDDPVPEPTLESEEVWQAKNMLLSNRVRKNTINRIAAKIRYWLYFSGKSTNSLVLWSIRSARVALAACPAQLSSKR